MAATDDELVATGRKAAWKFLLDKYPKLFPETLVRPGLLKFAVAPSLGFKEGGYDGYFEYTAGAFTPADLEAVWSVHSPSEERSLFDQFLRLFLRIDPSESQFLRLFLGTGPSEADTYLQESATFGKALGFTDSSINNMQLYTLALKDPALIAMADGRHQGIIKTQPFLLSDPDSPDEANPALLEFTNEVVVSRLLNTLVTAFKHTATPHFTAFLGCFKRNSVPGAWPGFFQPARVFAIYERANLSFNALLEGGVPQQLLGALLFQTLFTLDVAAYTLGYTHNDLHSGNIMVRDVTGTRYENRVWAYKLRGQSGYWFVHPSAHQNKMVEIIDEGRATIEASPPEDKKSLYRENFANDVRRLFYFLLLDLPSSPIASACEKIKALLPDHDGPRRANAAARQFYTRWFTDDPTYGLRPVLGVTSVRPPNEQQPPIVVAIAPDDTLVTRPDEPLAVELGLIWNPRQGMKRAYMDSPVPLKCDTCLAPARYALEREDKRIGFCGRDCARVYKGLYHV
jgi:hypothetical protein